MAFRTHATGRGTRFWLPVLLVLLSVGIGAAGDGGPRGRDQAAPGGAAPDAPWPAPQRVEQGGIAVELGVEPAGAGDGGRLGPVAGADAVVSLRVTDARTGRAVTGLHPNAWIARRRLDAPPGEAACRDRIRSLASGLLSIRADVDLNSYRVLTINHDGTISIIDPQVTFGITKLEGLVVLPGIGADWALSAGKDLLYVTLPGRSAVAVVSTVTRTLVGTIPTGAGTRPTRIAIQPDGRYAWVGLDGSPAVAVVDTAAGVVAATVPVGEGRHAIAFTADGRLAYVTGSAARTVTAVDVRARARVAEVAVGGTPGAVAYSLASRLVYVAPDDGAPIVAIDPERQRVVARIPAGRRIAALRFEPRGRFGFVVDRAESTLSVLDASTNAIVGAAAVVEEPDQVVFTRRFAYIRGVASEKVSLVELGEVEKGKVEPVDIVVARTPPGAAPDDIGAADAIAPTPEGNAVMVASAPDATLFYYVEGMMAPMGTFSNYRRRPRAALIVDRSLAEVEPGVYAAPVRLPAAGRFDVPVLVDQPRVVHCFALDVGASPGDETPAVSVRVEVHPLFADVRLRPGETAALRFRLVDPADGRPLTGLRDVQILVFGRPGTWQVRRWASHVGDGVYEVAQAFPRAGRYTVMVRVPSRGASYIDLPRAAVRVVAEPEPGGPADGGGDAREG